MVLEGNRFSVLFEYPQSIYTYGGNFRDYNGPVGGTSARKGQFNYYHHFQWDTDS